jgi:hypothetical protein
MRFWPICDRPFVGVFDCIRVFRKYKSFPTNFVDILLFLSTPRLPTNGRNRLRADGNLRRPSPFPYYIPYFQVGTGGRKPTRKFFRKRAVLFGKLAANRAFRPSLEEKTIQKIERQPI